MSLYIFEQTSSTNDLAKGAEYHHGDAIWAHNQTAGRGQRGNKWSGGVGENIAFSVVLEPEGLAASDQFLVSQIAALALYDVGAECGVECWVKWTNDLYVEDRKMAGILIENSLQSGCVVRSIVGIGFNINQTTFDPSLPNPTSMRLQSGVIYERESILKRVVERLMEWYSIISEEESGRNRIRQRYNNLLYRQGEQHTYRRANGELFEATIEEVLPQGELVLRDDAGERRQYLFREVEFVIEGRDR